MRIGPSGENGDKSLWHEAAAKSRVEAGQIPQLELDVKHFAKQSS
jgi:hypothetical protein